MTLSAQQIHDTLLLPYLNHAVRMFEAGYASAPDIDAAMRYGCGYAAGPLATLDEIGPAVVRDALAKRYAESGDALHLPAALLVEIADAGRTFADAQSGMEAPAPEFEQEIEKVGVVG